MSRIAKLLIALMLAVPLMGASCQTKTVPPEIVYVTVEKLPELTPDQKEKLNDCKKLLPVDESVDVLYQVAKARGFSLDKCNEDKKAIRGWFGIE